MGPESLSMAMNSMPVAYNRAQDRRMTRKGVPHRRQSLAPMNLAIKEFKRDVRGSGVSLRMQWRLIKRYKARAYEDLKTLKDAAPTAEQVILNNEQK